MLEQKNIIVSIAGGLLSSYQKVLLKQTINDHHYFDDSIGETVPA